MPPFLPVEDSSFETKQWASATIDTLFSDNCPISFEPHKPTALMKALNNSKVVPARRSVSVLDTSDLNRLTEERVRPWDTSSNNTSPTLFYSDSAPSLLITHHPQVSLSTRLKRTLTSDKSWSNKKVLSFKEKAGIDTWKLLFKQYLGDAKMVSFYLIR